MAYRQRPEVKKRKRVYGPPYRHRPEVKGREDRTNTCLGCGEEKKIEYIGLSLCRYCDDTRRWTEKYGSRENYRKEVSSPKAAEYRKSPTSSLPPSDTSLDNF